MKSKLLAMSLAVALTACGGGDSPYNDPGVYHPNAWSPAQAWCMPRSEYLAKINSGEYQPIDPTSIRGLDLWSPPYVVHRWYEDGQLRGSLVIGVGLFGPYYDPNEKTYPLWVCKP